MTAWVSHERGHARRSVYRTQVNSLGDAITLRWENCSSVAALSSVILLK